MTFIIKNNSGLAQTINDLGIRISNGSQRTLSNEFTYEELAKSSDLFTLVNAGTLIGNNGTRNLSNVESYDEVNYFRLIGEEAVDTLTIKGSGGIDAGTYRVKNVADPTTGLDAVNKAYLVTYVTAATAGAVANLSNVLSIGNSAGAYQIDMSTNKIVNLGVPTAGTDATTKNYVDTLVANSSGAETLAQILAKGNTSGGTNIDMGNNSKVVNLQDPTSLQDAATKSYVDTLVANSSGAETLAQILAKGNTSGGTQIDMQSQKIINVGSPTLSGDSANKEYVDTQLSLETLQVVTGRGATSSNTITLTNPGTGLIVQGTLVAQNFEAQKIITITSIISGNEIIAGGLTVNGDTILGDDYTVDVVTINGKTVYGHTPTSADELANKGYVDTLIATVSGNENLSQILAIGNSAGSYSINMNNNKITSLATPTNVQDATNKGYVDTLVANSSGAETLAQILAKGNTSGGTQIDMQSSKIINVGTCTATGDATNKYYVDLATGGATLQSAYNNGALISTSSINGPVVIDSSSNYKAPLQLTTLTVAPSSGLANGQLAFVSGELYKYDSVRSKWLGVTQTSYNFGRNAAAIGDQYLRVGEVVSSTSGYRIPFNATIVGITVQTDTSNSATYEVRTNNNATVITSLALSAVAGGSDTTINVDVSAGDWLQAYVTTSTGTVTRPIMTVYLANRA